MLHGGSAYVYMYVCMYVCIYVCMYVRMYVCTYVYMYVCNDIGMPNKFFVGVAQHRVACREVTAIREATCAATQK